MLGRPGVVACIGFKALTQVFLCGAVRSMYLDVVISLAYFAICLNNHSFFSTLHLITMSAGRPQIIRFHLTRMF
jgi:hypothetical protein